MKRWRKFIENQVKFHVLGGRQEKSRSRQILEVNFIFFETSNCSNLYNFFFFFGKFQVFMASQQKNITKTTTIKGPFCLFLESNDEKWMIRVISRNVSK